jgi:hypothetical protein
MAIELHSLVPLVHVRNVPASVAFYERLASQQAVIFAMYVKDVEAKHKELVAAGVPAGPIERPFFRPGGHFRIEDPDGYVINVTYPDRES